MLGQDRLALLDEALRRLPPEGRRGRAAFLLRYGFALPPPGRVGRQPVSDFTSAFPLNLLKDADECSGRDAN
jgi:hypothetical protein